jgi:predicted metalloprotease with PDZ domain
MQHFFCRSRFFILVVVLCMAGIKPLLAVAPPATPTLKYTVNLNDRADDYFKVRLAVSGLKAENAVYQFASTAPGTYQVMDMGRYVRSFKAFDKNGKELKTERLNVNQWKIADAPKAAEIRYSIAETWDSVVKENHIYEMCGSSLEQDHALLNGQTVFGYPTGLQSTPLTVKLERPAEWMVGTPLDTNAQGEFLARNYDHIVDSPILLGKLTKAQTQVKGSSVEIFTYSKTGKITSEQLLKAMQEMLTAAGEFMRELPVKRYAFIWHFEDKSVGAWEHSYSSEYVMEERDYTPEYGQQLKDIAAHEFFHVITPLNIHSEIIEKFNFVTPTASEHLWLYEGTTEWAAHIMQLRGGLISLDKYLREQSQKLLYDRFFYNPSYSLSKISLTSFTPDGQKQYGNIYQRGALVAMLLDIRLLELSGGKRGLREVILELAKKYGPSKPFSEKGFVDEFVAMTYPEIRDFFDSYVRSVAALPVKEYFEKIGVNYYDAKPTGREVPELGIKSQVKDTKLVVTDYRQALDSIGLRENDELVMLNGQKISSSPQLGGMVSKLTGTTATLTVAREGREITLTLPIGSRKEEKPFVFEVAQNPFKKQVALRETWLRNLK